MTLHIRNVRRFHGLPPDLIAQLAGEMVTQALLESPQQSMTTTGHGFTVSWWVKTSPAGYVLAEILNTTRSTEDAVPDAD